MTVLDIRTYRLRPGKAAEFDRLARALLPMLERYGIQVVACAPSIDGDDHYVVIRSFSSDEEREEQLGSFYGSQEWRENHRDSVLALIESYHTVAIEVTDAVRGAVAPPALPLSYATSTGFAGHVPHATCGHGFSCARTSSPFAGLSSSWL